MLVCSGRGSFKLASGLAVSAGAATRCGSQSVNAGVATVGVVRDGQDLLVQLGDRGGAMGAAFGRERRDPR